MKAQINNRSPNRWFRKSIFLPFLLVIVGILLLWQVVSGQGFDITGLVLGFWPLILILSGLEGIVKRRATAVNTFMVTSGLALQLSNLDRISWTSWEIVLSFWPVLFIAFGVDLIFGRDRNWDRLFSSLVILVIIVGVVYVFSFVEEEENKILLSPSRQDADEAKIKLEPSIGFMKTYAQGNSELLIDGEINLWGAEKVAVQEMLLDEKIIYEISSSGLAFIYEPGIENRANWRIGLNSWIPVELEINQILGEMDIELTGLIVLDYKQTLTAGTTILTLPSGVDLNGQINQVIGDTIVYVPQSTGLEVESSLVFGNVSMPENFNQRGHVYKSEKYDSSENQIHLKIDKVIGQLIVRER